MKTGLLSTTTEFKEIETLEPGTWINLVNPSQNESMEIASAFNIDIADFQGCPTRCGRNVPYDHRR